MADKISKDKRSYVMSRIRSNNTNAEKLLRKSIEGTFLRYQPKIFGKPDFGLINKKIAIFVDGCFWHKCPKCFRKPKSNTKYWRPKIDNNAQRDKKITRKLRSNGWKVIRIREHQIYSNLQKCEAKVRVIIE
ncbi:DNA mismatch endonuclease Vsr [Candidatus Woesearchaeota archaeon]|nr:DNA mismatch endonuclease Vsr [Candidatus Woesearchaeota archaeon]